jgi:Polyketide cyclase / dehydrase and lipid transport
MFRIGASVLIQRAPGDVFAFVADLRNFPLWRANLASSTVVSVEFTGVGARCEESIQAGPRTIPATCQITSFSPGRTFSFEARSYGPHVRRPR